MGDWAGIGAPLTPAPSPQPNATCIAAYNALSAPVKSAIDAHKSDMAKAPLISMACIAPLGSRAPDVTKAQLQSEFEEFFHLASVCPPLCYPDSQVSVTSAGTTDSESICPTSGEMVMMKQQVEDIPIYKSSGTGGRFPPGNKASELCTFVVQMMQGYAAGVESPDTGMQK